MPTPVSPERTRVTNWAGAAKLQKQPQVTWGRGLTDNDIFEQIRVSGHVDGLKECGERGEARVGANRYRQCSAKQKRTEARGYREANAGKGRQARDFITTYWSNRLEIASATETEAVRARVHASGATATSTAQIARDWVWQCGNDDDVVLCKHQRNQTEDAPHSWQLCTQELAFFVKKASWHAVARTNTQQTSSFFDMSTHTKLRLPRTGFNDTDFLYVFLWNTTTDRGRVISPFFGC